MNACSRRSGDDLQGEVDRARAGDLCSLPNQAAGSSSEGGGVVSSPWEDEAAHREGQRMEDEVKNLELVIGGAHCGDRFKPWDLR